MNLNSREEVSFVLNPVKVLLTGGLGNQLFQVSAMKYFSDTFKRDFYLSISRYSHTRWSHDLSWMPIFFKDQSALEKEFSFLTKIDRKLSNSFGVYARLRHVQVQHEIGFDSRFVIRESTNEIRGYFQSYIYAEKYKSDFAMKLSKVGHTSKLLEIRNLADARKPIALHVRCGDYLKLGRIYGSLSHVYYDEALGYLQQYGNLSDIWIFSDDLFHARKILSGSKYLSDMNFEIANQFDGTQTMYLMSHCDRHIIANSTFSWWGAFLASKSRAVVAPEPWFRNGATPNQLIPREWKSIQRST